MKLHRAVILTVLVLALAAVASAAGYGFTLNAPLKVGSNDLAPGDYKVSIQGSIGVITQVKTSKSFTVFVRLETAIHDYDKTALEISNAGGEQKQKALDVGGSNTRLVFE